MNQEIVKEIVDREFIYRIYHTRHWGNLAPKGADESDFHSIDSIEIHSAHYSKETPEGNDPWVFTHFATMHYWDAPIQYIQGTLILATIGNVDYNTEEGVYPFPEGACIETLKEQIPVKYTIHYKTTLRGRDSGSAHSDPYNDIVTSKSCTIYWRDTIHGEQNYKHGFGYGCDVWGISQAYIYLTEAFEMGRTPEFTDHQKENIVGFEFCQHVFRLPYPITDKRVVGECISGTYLDIQEGENTLIADKGDSYEQMFRYHYRGYAYAINYAIYHDGKCLIRNFKQFLSDHIGVPDCLVDHITDSVLHMAFYKAGDLLPIIQKMAESPINEFIGWNGDATTNVNPLEGGEVAIKFPVLYEDGTKEMIHIQWFANKLPWDELMEHLQNHGQWEKITHIRCLGHWLVFDADEDRYTVERVSFGEGQRLDTLLRS